MKNLSREELDSLAEEGIYGPKGNPKDRGGGDRGGSQRSLNLPGTSRDFDSSFSLHHHQVQASRTPQPARKSSATSRFHQQDFTGGRRFHTPLDEPPGASTSGSVARRSEFRIPFPVETRSSLTSVFRRSEDSAPAIDDSSARSSPEVEDPTRSSKHSDDDSSRLSPTGYEVFDQEDSPDRSAAGAAAGLRHRGEDTFEDSDERMELGEGSSVHTLVYEERDDDADERTSDPRADIEPAPSYTAVTSATSPPEADIGDSLSPLFPRCPARTYGSSQYGDAKPTGAVIPGFVTYETRQSLRAANLAGSDETGRAEGLASPTETTPQSPLAGGKSSPHCEEDREESPKKVSARFRHHDSTRLRPPLVGTAGTSADSGTGDSGSAEIQADTLGSLQPSGSDGTDQKFTGKEGRSPGGTKTPGGGKGGKQTVKPFTKESLDRLENRTVQLVREYGFQPRRKTSVEDGAVLPNKFEPFPSDLYGRPLEEIDNFIYDEVSPSLH